jgi:peptidoglycan/xylan/chitin deacetylase (PgdA/CDA1 family)
MKALRCGLVVLMALLAGCAVSAPGSLATTPLPTIAVSTTAVPSSSAPTTPAAPQTPSSSPTAPVPTRCAKPATGFVRVAPGKGKTVALTFDDGPGPADTAIVEILDRYSIHATFFETGAHAAADPATVRLLAAHGEVIADHSWDHLYPTQVRGGWTPAYLQAQFRRTDSALTRLTGQPVCFVRPPGGFTQNVVAAATRLKLSAVLWSVDSLDWQQPPRTTKAATAAIVANATAPGGRRHPIVLMHSTKASHEPESRVSSYRGNTVAALPAVIGWYRSHGYRFVTLGGAA